MKASRLSKLLTAPLLTLLCTQALSAQSDSPNPQELPPGVVDAPGTPEPVSSVGDSLQVHEYDSYRLPETDYPTQERHLYNKYELNRILRRYASIDAADLYVTPGVASIAEWSGGGIYASGGVSAMPGLMDINAGTLTLHQSVGNLELSVYGAAAKYGFFRGVRTQYGFGGDLTYHASDRVSITIFGNWYADPGIDNPAMAGYISVPRFGGYMDYRFADRWGVKVGGQAYRSVMSNRWEAQPIIEPYFMITPGQAIGVDVGGIVYQLLKSASGQNHAERMGNPTIGPPVTKLSETFH